MDLIFLVLIASPSTQGEMTFVLVGADTDAGHRVEQLAGAIRESLEPLPRDLLLYRDAEVRGDALSELLGDILPRSMDEGDVLFLYCAGAHTAETDGLRFKGWRRENGWTDTELRSWLAKLEDKGVTTVLVGERDREHALGGSPVAMYEMWGDPARGFPDALCQAVAQDLIGVSLDTIVKEMGPAIGVVRGTNVETGSSVVFDTGHRTLEVVVQDRYQNRLLKAKVSVDGHPTQGNPAVFKIEAGADAVTVAVECEGYSSQASTVYLGPGRDDYVWFDLEPEGVLLDGRVLGIGDQNDVRVGFELAEGSEETIRLVGAPEVSVDDDGRFQLRVPPRRAGRVLAFHRGRVIAQCEVGSLEPKYRWDPNEMEMLEAAHDLGDISVGDLSEATAETWTLHFERGLRVGLYQVSDNELEGALETLTRARDALPEDAEVAMILRVERAIRYVEQKLDEWRWFTLEDPFTAGHLSSEERRQLAEQALAENPGVELHWAIWAIKDAQDMEYRIRLDGQSRARAENDLPTYVDGFTYAGANAFGKDTYHHDLTGLMFVHIPAGTFVQGPPTSDPVRYPFARARRKVTLSPYLIAETEVTQRVFEKVMSFNPSEFRKGSAYPVDMKSR